MYQLKILFYIFRSDSAFKGSTIALGIVCFLLLISYLLTCLCLFKKRGELYILRNPDQFRQKIKVSDEEIGELHDTNMLETSIIEPPRETVRIRNIDTVSYSIAQNASLPDVDETGQVNLELKKFFKSFQGLTDPYVPLHPRDNMKFF